MTTTTTAADPGALPAGAKTAFCYRCCKPQLPGDMRTVRAKSGARVKRCLDCVAGRAPVNKPGALRAR